MPLPKLILAPLRGVTIRAFRETYAPELVAAGFEEALTPFIPAMRGVDPLKDRELKGTLSSTLRLTPQFIGKDPVAFRETLQRVRAAGFTTADLNCGCPFPMVRNKGRGSGLLRTPETLLKMLAAGCEIMGPGNFSIKTRLGVERPDELLQLLPLLNAFPLRFMTVHARTARQMYDGKCDLVMLKRIMAAAEMPVVPNGDLELPCPTDATSPVMIGRSFIRQLGTGPESTERLRRYLDYSRRELAGDRPVLGRLKELVAYWKELPNWHRRWNLIKLCRTIAELEAVI